MGIIYLASGNLKLKEQFNLDNVLCSYLFIKKQDLSKYLENKEKNSSENKNK